MPGATRPRAEPRPHGSSPRQPPQALVTNPICASGVGDGCAELAAGESPLIAELQARSAEKREQRRKESLERYSVNNFSDFFAVDNKSLVRHADERRHVLRRRTSSPRA